MIKKIVIVVLLICYSLQGWTKPKFQGKKVYVLTRDYKQPIECVMKKRVPGITDWIEGSPFTGSTTIKCNGDTLYIAKPCRDLNYCESVASRCEDTFFVRPGIATTFMIYYPPNKATPISESKIALKMANNIVRNFPEAQIKVESFTDPIGPPSFNKKLSRERALNVAHFLIDNGLTAQQIDPISYRAPTQHSLEQVSKNMQAMRATAVTIILPVSREEELVDKLNSISDLSRETKYVWNNGFYEIK